MGLKLNKHQSKKRYSFAGGFLYVYHTNKFGDPTPGSHGTPLKKTTNLLALYVINGAKLSRFCQL